MHKKLRFGWLVFVSVSVVACGGSGSGSGAGDAGSGADVGALDSGRDSGTVMDSGRDTGTAMDTGAAEDTGTDATSTMDGAVDGAMATDAALDGALSMDGSTDAAVDAGFDAGPPDPCASQCGAEELCDGPEGLGLDDNCNGAVDETCPCVPGTVQSCFLGDPSLVTVPGCFAGQQICTENATWDVCTGGFHAADGCATSGTGCHAITGLPFLPVDLETGLGDFGQDALSATWSVACPAGVSPCPAVAGTSVTPLVSGEYTVTYEKTTAGGTDSCTFPLFVGARGLRVELSWEWDAALGSSTVDLDLRVHRPGDTMPWGGTQGTADVCAYNNCTATDYSFGFGGVSWFSDVATPPDPVNWYLDPVFEQNTCYFAPKGVGAEWQSLGMGCHSPRLDADNITCDPTVTDPQNSAFCNAENINIDFPPRDQWTRIGVHYYFAHSQVYDVHPVVKVFCDGRPAATLGAEGYDSPVTFTPADVNDFWLAADVLYREDACGNRGCVVQPLYADSVTRTPLVSTATDVTSSFGPAYPPLP